MESTTEMYKIYCPFCYHLIYEKPKQIEFEHLERINNCAHISVQFFEDKDTVFLMSDSTRELLSAAFSDFLMFKGIDFAKNLIDQKIIYNYNINEFLSDIYVNNKLSEDEELKFLTLFEERSPNYDLKVSNCIIDDKVIVNYFMKENIE